MKKRWALLLTPVAAIPFLPKQCAPPPPDPETLAPSSCYTIQKREPVVDYVFVSCDVGYGVIEVHAQCRTPDLIGGSYHYIFRENSGFKFSNIPASVTTSCTSTHTEIVGDWYVTTGP